MNNSNWIRNPGYDLLFFSAFWWVPAGISLFYFHSATYMAIFFVAYHLLLRIPHFVVTLNYTYLLKENKEHYRKNWIRFFVIPIMILLAYASRRSFDASGIYSRTIFTVALVWGTQHVAFQNYGILSLYRTRSDARKDTLLGKIEKLVFLELTSLLIYKVILSYWFESFYVENIVNAITKGLYILIGITLLTYFLRLWTNRKIAKSSLPGILYFLTAVSASFYWPIYDKIGGSSDIGSEIYFYVLNGHHCLAYLGLIYHMDKNKKSAEKTNTNFLKFFIPSLLGSIFLMTFVISKWHNSGSPFTTEAGYDALALLEGIFVAHYYLESNTWKFSSPHTRLVILPLLKTPTAQ